MVDELHSFIGNERGRQLQSLLHRIEQVLQRRVRRLALSATLGEMSRAAAFLRPGASRPAELIVSSGGDQEIRLQVRGYRQREPSQETVNAGKQGIIKKEPRSVIRPQSQNICSLCFGEAPILFSVIVVMMWRPTQTSCVASANVSECRTNFYLIMEAYRGRSVRT